MIRLILISIFFISLPIILFVQPLRAANTHKETILSDDARLNLLMRRYSSPDFWRNRPRAKRKFCPVFHNRFVQALETMCTDSLGDISFLITLCKSLKNRKLPSEHSQLLFKAIELEKLIKKFHRSLTLLRTEFIRILRIACKAVNQPITASNSVRFSIKKATSILHLISPFLNQVSLKNGTLKLNHTKKRVSHQ